MKILKVLVNVLTWLFLITIIALAIITIITNFNIFIGYQSFLVQSGSMEPAIMIGDIVVVQKQNQYFKNDVITFLNKDQRVVTHRIIETKETDGEIQFITKGDANRSEDEDSIVAHQVLGKVVFVIPKLGFFVAFAKSIFGLILLIIVPSVILIINQLIEMKNG